MSETRDQRPGCLGRILQMFGLQPQAKPARKQLPYHRVDNFLSPAEVSFYHVLRQVVGEQAAISTKVSLGDLFYAKTGDRRENLRYRNKIDRKHVDFLLCDPQSMQPLMGIELDDVSHNRPARQARDEFVNRVFEAAGLPLMRVPAQASYAPREIAAQLESVRSGEDATAGKDAPEKGPVCPSCGVPMVVRSAKRGPYKGEQFYVCPNYPECKELIPIR